MCYHLWTPMGGWIRQHIRPLGYTALSVATIFLFTACSALSFTYNHAERLLLWKIDSYFHLSNDQEGLVQGRLADLHAWHRKAELPRYADFLSHVQDRWQDGLSAEDVDWVFDTFQQLRAELAERIAAEGSSFLTTVDAKQIRYLERVVQRENRDLQAKVEMKPERRAEKRVKTAMSWLKDWLGRLTPEQEQRIVRLIKELPDSPEDHLAYRVQRQHEFVQLLQSKPKASTIAHRLQEWLATPEKNSSPAYALSVQHMREDLKRTVLAIDRTITPGQRVHASEKLQKLIRDIQALAAS
jgi:uncharacterized protein DUF6279